jgi:hypothetical protein
VLCELMAGRSKRMIPVCRSFQELQKFQTFKERYFYLRLTGNVGAITFGFDRYMNQTLYRSPQWRKSRSQVILRDNGQDLGLTGYSIPGKIVVHHMNPISIEDLEQLRDIVFNPEYLICVSPDTHNAIHFGDDSLLPQDPIQRRTGDMCPWR